MLSELALAVEALGERLERMEDTLDKISAAEHVEDGAGEQRDGPVVPGAEPLQVRSVAVDEGVGTMVAALRAKGELGKTLFIFTSDNGLLAP